MHLTAVVTFLKQVDELDTARQLLDTFAKYASGLEQYDELGMLYEKVKAYPQSIEMIKKCAAIAGPRELYAIRCNMAKVYNHMNEPQKALQYIRMNQEINPEDNEMKMEESFSHYLMGDSVKSYEIQSALLDKQIDDQLKKRIMYNMGTFQMERGKVEEGLKNMIMGGRGIGIWPPHKRPYPKWDGQDTKKTILIYAEAGIGDELINIRFMNELKKRNLKAIWIGFRKDLIEVFNANGYTAIDNKTQLDPLEEYVYLEAMSLPIYLEMKKENYWSGAYLKPEQSYIDKWKKLLPEKFITLRWSGNPYYDQDLHRFVDRDTLVNKFAELNLPMISLQIDKKCEDSRLIDVDVESWQDTLAIQYLSTYNITSCTSTAHSAAAMGTKTVVLPPIATYYVWVPLKDDDTSYWYGDNTRIFPQKKHKNWQESIDKAFDYVRNDI